MESNPDTMGVMEMAASCVGEKTSVMVMILARIFAPQFLASSNGSKYLKPFACCDCIQILSNEENCKPTTTIVSAAEVPTSEDLSDD